MASVVDLSSRTDDLTGRVADSHRRGRDRISAIANLHHRVSELHQPIHDSSCSRVHHCLGHPHQCAHLAGFCSHQRRTGARRVDHRLAQRLRPRGTWFCGSRIRREASATVAHRRLHQHASHSHRVGGSPHPFDRKVTRMTGDRSTAKDKGEARSASPSSPEHRNYGFFFVVLICAFELPSRSWK